MVPMHCLLAAFFLVLGASQAAAARTGATGTGDMVKKVPMALYYESLCPFSVEFIVDNLSQFFDPNDGVADAADLKLVPYGNAKLEKNGTISCQHGPLECLINTVEACAIDVWPDSKVHLGFISCVEDLARVHEYLQWPSCFNTLGLDARPFYHCFDTDRGDNVSLKFVKETDALVPPHKYVPWVVVDGKPLYEDYQHYKAYVCKAYKGTPPKACQGQVIHGGDHNPAVAKGGSGAGAGGGVSYYKSGGGGDDDIKFLADRWR